jgi:hypothetical protein
LPSPLIVVARTSYLGGPAADEAVPHEATASAHVTHTAANAAASGRRVVRMPKRGGPAFCERPPLEQVMPASPDRSAAATIVTGSGRPKIRAVLFQDNSLLFQDNSFRA